MFGSDPGPRPHTSRPSQRQVLAEWGGSLLREGRKYKGITYIYHKLSGKSHFATLLITLIQKIKYFGYFFKLSDV